MNGCGACHKAFEMLNAYNAKYESVDVETLKNFEFSTVPQVYYGDKHLGGLKELEEFLNSRDDYDVQNEHEIESESESESSEMDDMIDIPLTNSDLPKDSNEMSEQFDKDSSVQVSLVTRKGCSYCAQAKHLLDNLNIPFTEFETVPQIWFYGKHIGGYEDLKEILSQFKTQKNALKPIEFLEDITPTLEKWNKKNLTLWTTSTGVKIIGDERSIVENLKDVISDDVLFHHLMIDCAKCIGDTINVTTMFKSGNLSLWDLMYKNGKSPIPVKIVNNTIIWK